MKKLFLTTLIIFLFFTVYFSLELRKNSVRLGMKEFPLATTEKEECFCQLNQSVSTLADGGFAVVWEKGKFPGRDVVMQWITPQMNTRFGQGGITIAASAKDEAGAVVAAHPSGGAFVAFVKRVRKGSRIRVQYFNADAKPMWPGDDVPASPTSSYEFQNEPNLVPDPWGGVYVCFRATFGTTNQIMCQHLDANGNRMWNRNKQRAGGMDGLQVFPRGVADGRGGLLVFWRNQRDPFSEELDPMLMEGQHFSSSGNKLWGEKGMTVRETKLAATNEWTYKGYSAVSDGKGGAILVFNDWVNLEDPNMDVVAQRITYKGKLQWKKYAVVTSTDGHQQHVASIASGNGGVFVVVFCSLNETQNKLRIYRLNPGGKHKWKKSGILLSDPSILRLEYGTRGSFDNKRLRLTWTRQLQPYSYEFDVMMARLTDKGKFIGTPKRITLIDAPKGQFTRDAVFNRSSGIFFSVWDDYRNSYTFGNCDVYGASIKNRSRLEVSDMDYHETFTSSSYSLSFRSSCVLNGNLLTYPVQLPNQKICVIRTNGKS